MPQLTLQEILHRHIQALGGREALEATAFHTIRSKSDGGNPQFHCMTLDERGRRVRIDAELPILGISLTKAFDGRHAWETGPIYNGYYPESHPETLQFSNELLPLWLEAAPSDGGPSELRLLGLRPSSDGVDCYVLERSKQNQAGQKIPVRDFLDASSFLPREQRQGASDEEISIFGDYRPVEGRLWPFRMEKMDACSGDKHIQQTLSIEFPSPADSIFEHPTESAPQGQSAETNLDAASLELVWKTLDNVFYDPSFGGVDWKAVRERYLPQARDLDGLGGKQFENLTTRMINELGVTHCSIKPREHVRSGEAKDQPPGKLGLALRWVEGAAVVYDLEPEGPAEKAGLKKGDLVTAINGKDDAALNEAHANSIAHCPNPHSRAVEPYNQELRVMAGDRVSVAYQDGQGRAGVTELIAQEKKEDGDPRLKAERLGPILKISFQGFSGGLIEKFSKALAQNPDASGLIIDIRGNLGGDASLPMLLAGMLLRQPASLGRMIYRSRSLDLRIHGTEEAYQGPVAILIDEWSASCSELFSGNLQEMGRARIFGRRSLGAVLPATMLLLPNGCAFKYPICDYLSGSGKRLEGVGVEPNDGSIELRRGHLLEGRDPDLEAALRWLNEEVGG